MESQALDPDSIERAMLDVVGERHRPEQQWFWTELAILAERWSPIGHPYVAAWGRGELGAHDLHAHASEYDSVLVAQTAVADSAAGRAAGLLGELLEQEAEVARTELSEWRAFARAVGWRGATAWSYGEDPCTETAEASRTIAGSTQRTLGEDVATLLVLVGRHATAATRQLPALSDHYRLGAVSCAWFERHATTGAERAAQLQAALEGLLSHDDPLVVVRHAATLHRRLHQVLDRLQDARA